MSAVQRHIVFLRAINVSGRRVTNDQIVEPLTAAGFSGVTAYQAAGNVVLDSDLDAAAVRATVETALAEAFGFEVPTFVRSPERIRHVVAATPFADDEVAAAQGKPQVAFLLAAPTDPSAVAALDTPADRLVLDGTEVHWLPANGVGRAELDVDALTRAAGPLTIRTVGTVSRIAKKFL